MAAEDSSLIRLVISFNGCSGWHSLHQLFIHSESVCCLYSKRQSWLFVLHISICAVLDRNWKSNAATGKALFELNDKTCIFTFSPWYFGFSLSTAMMGRMGPLLAAALWIRRRVLGWCSIPPSLRVKEGNLSSTAPTLTTTCPPRPCQETPPSTARGKPFPSTRSTVSLFTVSTFHF